MLFRKVAVAGALGLSLVSSASGQAGRVPRHDARALIAQLAEDYTAGRSRSDAFNALVQLLVRPESAGPELHHALNGLEELALTGTSSRARQTAVSLIALSGSTLPEHPVPGVQQRLETLYGRSRDGSVRATIVSDMSTLADREPAIRFLERELTAVPDSGLPSVAENAFRALAAMGPPGIAVLKRADAEGAVHDPHLRAVLADFVLRRFGDSP